MLLASSTVSWRRSSKRDTAPENEKTTDRAGQRVYGPVDDAAGRFHFIRMERVPPLPEATAEGATGSMPAKSSTRSMGNQVMSMRETVVRMLCLHGLPRASISL